MLFLPETTPKTPREKPRIYVLKFRDGRIKVGRSCDIRGRVRSLQWDPFGTGKQVIDGWYSDGHSDSESNEMRLILFCREQFGTPVRGTSETFEGDYQATVTFAQSLMDAPDLSRTAREDYR